MLISSLKNQREFDLINQLGKRFHGSYFIIIVVKDFVTLFTKTNKGNNDAEKISPMLASNTTLFGIKAGNRLGNAVIRNKIKRRIRHLVRLLIKDSKFQQNNWAIIVIPKKGFEKVDFMTLLSELYTIILKS